MANILLIYGHPKTPKSFNFDLKEKLVEALKQHVHNVLVRDLYEISFNPLLSSKDLELIHNGQISEDIRKEQEFIKNADTIIFIYPIWWAGQPAIIKGYIDRVFSYGFAYMYKGGKVIGLLPDKKAIIINSNGNPSALYKKNDFYNAMKLLVDKGIFAFYGFSKIKHLFYGDMSTKSDDDKSKDINNAIDETIIEIEAKNMD